MSNPAPRSPSLSDQRPPTRIHHPPNTRVALTITKSLSDSEVRNAIWRLFSTITDAIDTDASHVQMTIQLTTPTATKDKIAEAAEAAGLDTTVRSL